MTFQQTGGQRRSLIGEVYGDRRLEGIVGKHPGPVGYVAIGYSQTESGAPECLSATGELVLQRRESPGDIQQAAQSGRINGADADGGLDVFRQGTQIDFR